MADLLGRSKDFLATRIVYDKEPITYSLLSRELKIHNTASKKCLFAFHDAAKDLYPGRVHATYIIVGIKSPDSQDDIIMSDVPSSSPVHTQPDSNAEEVQENIHTTTIELVQEEDLEQVKLQFKSISSLHVYSLEPGRLPDDFASLADCGRKVRDFDMAHTPEIVSNTYGVILNLEAKPRQGVASPLLISQPVKDPSSTGISKPESVKSSPALDSQKPASKSGSFFNSKSYKKPGPKKSDINSTESTQETLKRELDEPIKAEPSKPGIIKSDKPKLQSNAEIKHDETVKPVIISEELKNMFSDGDDDNDNKDDDNSENEEIANDSGNEAESIIKKSDSRIEGIIPVDEEAETGQNDDSTNDGDVQMELATSIEPPEPPSPNGPKKKLVTKERKVQYMSDGFLATRYEKYHEWVIDDSPEVEQIKPKVSTPRSGPAKAEPDIKKPTTKKKGSTGTQQQSLMNFFTKK
ncbi:DNA polymerase subunit Cdc27 [Lipomyces japonicus]|uniref:DNA polymerase subunit Cdc27 n=1 Tax=Lipomyces japonicus TaxID=56871 RepID=UPI0034CD5EF4